MKTTHLSKIVSITALATFLLSTGSVAADPSRKDKSFVTDAAEGGLTEVQMGELAKAQGKSEAVKTMGELLVTDHSKANDELKTIASGKGIEVPAEPGMVQKAKLLLLKKKEGEAFDKAFAEDAVSAHKKTIKMFETAAKECDDADLKAFAEKTLPVLKTHLEHAKLLEPKK